MLRLKKRKLDILYNNRGQCVQYELEDMQKWGQQRALVSFPFDSIYLVSLFWHFETAVVLANKAASVHAYNAIWQWYSALLSIVCIENHGSFTQEA